MEFSFENVQIWTENLMNSTNNSDISGKGKMHIFLLIASCSFSENPRYLYIKYKSKKFLIMRLGLMRDR